MHENFIFVINESASLSTAFCVFCWWVVGLAEGWTTLAGQSVTGMLISIHWYGERRIIYGHREILTLINLIITIHILG